MFNYHNIILISKENLTVSKVSGQKIKSTQSFVWNSESLTQQLGAIKARFGSNYRILLDDVFVYTAHLYLNNSNNTREIVQEKAQEIIPEDLSQTIWDFKEEAELRDDNQKDGRFYQILAVNKQFYALLSSAINTLGLKIEAIEPVSQSLCRQLAKKNSEPFFILYHQNQSVLITCFGDIVIDVKTLGPNLTIEALQQYQQFVEQKYGLKPSKIFIPNQYNLNENLEQIGLGIEKYDYQPELALQQKTALRGDDLAILNLEPKRESSDQNSLNLIQFSKKIVAICILLLLLLGIYRLFSNNKLITTLQPKPSASEKVTPTKTQPKAVNYSITILNGNGVEGAASEAEALLDQQEYKVVNLDNADNYDYEQTVIQHKKNVAPAFISKLDKLLKTQYDVIIDDQFLDQSAKSAIVIILGKK